MDRHQFLTPRERAVLALLCEGLSAGEIAERECVSLHTIRTQIAAVLSKLGARSQLQAVAMTHQILFEDAWASALAKLQTPRG